MRPLISYGTALQLIDCIPSIQGISFENDNVRILEDHYQTFLHTYDCRDLIKLIKTISTRQAAAVIQGRKFSQTDERYIKKGERFTQQ